MNQYCPVTYPILTELLNTPPHQIFTDSSEWAVSAKSRITRQPANPQTFLLRAFYAVGFMAFSLAAGKGALSPLWRDFNMRKSGSNLVSWMLLATHPQEYTAEFLKRIEDACAEAVDYFDLDRMNSHLKERDVPWDGLDQTMRERLQCCREAAQALRPSLKSGGRVSRAVGVCTTHYLILARSEPLARELIAALLEVSEGNPIVPWPKGWSAKVAP